MRTYKEVLGICKQAADFGILNYGSHAGNTVPEPYQGVFGTPFNWTVWNNLLSKGFNSPAAGTQTAAPVNSPKAQPAQVPVSTAKPQAAVPAKAPAQNPAREAVKPATPTYKSTLQKSTAAPAAVPQSVPTQKSQTVPVKPAQAVNNSSTVPTYTSTLQKTTQTVKEPTVEELIQRGRRAQQQYEATQKSQQEAQRRKQQMNDFYSKDLTREQLQQFADDPNADESLKQFANQKLQQTPMDRMKQKVTDTVNEARLGLRNAAGDVQEAVRGAAQSAVNFIRGKQGYDAPYVPGSYDMNTPRNVYEKPAPVTQASQPAQKPAPVRATEETLKQYNTPVTVDNGKGRITMTQQQAKDWNERPGMVNVGKPGQGNIWVTQEAYANMQKNKAQQPVQQPQYAAPQQTKPVRTRVYGSRRPIRNRVRSIPA